MTYEAQSMPHGLAVMVRQTAGHAKKPFETPLL